MKTNKLKLSDLKVKSFVTAIAPASQKNLVGGEIVPASKINCSYDDGCITGGPACEVTNISPLC